MSVMCNHVIDMAKSHRVVQLCAFLVLILGCFVGCEEDENTTKTGDEISLSSKLISVDSVMFDLVEKDFDHLVFAWAQDSIPFKTGDLLVGLQAGGYARKIRSVTKLESALIVMTTNASLEELIISGKLVLDLPLHDLNAPVDTLGRHLLPPLDVDETTSNGSRVVSSGMGSTFDASIQLKLRFDRGLAEGEITLDSEIGNIHSIDLTTTSPLAWFVWQNEGEQGFVRQQFYTLDGIVMPIKIDVRFPLGGVAYYNGSNNVSFDLTSVSHILSKFEFNGADWNMSDNVESVIEQHEMDWFRDGGLLIDLTNNIGVTIRLFDQVLLDVDLNPEVKLECDTWENNWSWDLTSKLTASEQFNSTLLNQNGSETDRYIQPNQVAHRSENGLIEAINLRIEYGGSDYSSNNSVILNENEIGGFEGDETIVGYHSYFFPVELSQLRQTGPNQLLIRAPQRNNYMDDLQIRNVSLQTASGTVLWSYPNVFHLGDNSLEEIEAAWLAGTWGDANPPEFWAPLHGPTVTYTFWLSTL